MDSIVPIFKDSAGNQVALPEPRVHFNVEDKTGYKMWLSGLVERINAAFDPRLPGKCNEKFFSSVSSSSICMKNDFKLLKCLKFLKSLFFCLQNTRFLTSKVSRGLGSSVNPKRAIVTSFCVPRPCTSSITNVDLKCPMLHGTRREIRRRNVGCYWRDRTNNLKINWSLTRGVHVNSAGNLCRHPRCLISKEIPLRFILGSSLSMAPSQPYTEIRAHKHNSPVFVAQG